MSWRRLSTLATAIFIFHLSIVLFILQYKYMDPLNLEEWILKRNFMKNKIKLRNKVCVVVRTYPGQFYHPIYSLDNFLKSMSDMNHKDIELLVMLSDSRGDISELYRITEKYLHSFPITNLDFKDRPNFKPKGVLNTFFDKRQFHHLLYTLTDRAISYCSPDSNWLLVTNGDNQYDANFLDFLDSRYDIIRYDYFSRYKSRLRKYDYCNRLIGNASLVPKLYACKTNLGTYTHTDLGANVFNMKKWQLENRSYSQLRIGNNKKPKANHDFLMMKTLLTSGWSSKHISKLENGCLYNHNPNYQSCMSHSNHTIWNDLTEQCIIPTENIKLSIDLELIKTNTNVTRCIGTAYVQDDSKLHLPDVLSAHNKINKF